MNVKEVCRDFQDFLEARLNTQVAIEAAEISKTVAGVRKVVLGWKDPTGLQEYPQAFIIPDFISQEPEKKLAVIQLAVVMAVKGSSTEDVSDIQLIYADALANILETDPTAGGTGFEVNLENIDISLPGPGSAPVGVVTALISVLSDRIFQ